MFRVFMQDTRPQYSLALAQAWIDDWIADEDTWTGDPITHEIRPGNTEIDGSGTDYFGGDFRFEKTNSEGNIASNFASFVGVFTTWHRLGYHLCPHDEANGGSCSWDSQYEDGSVPSDIPEFV
jgi:hypothetical protein